LSRPSATIPSSTSRLDLSTLFSAAVGTTISSNGVGGLVGLLGFVGA
jgi:hypothetical protein